MLMCVSHARCFSFFNRLTPMIVTFLKLTKLLASYTFHNQLLFLAQLMTLKWILPAPVSQTFIHEDLKFVPNNFMAPLHKSTSSDRFHVWFKISLASGPLGFALTHPTRVSAKPIQKIWHNSSIADNGNIIFTYADNTFVITRDVIVKALRLPEGLSTNVSYSETEMKNFITHIGYYGDMRRMGRLVRTKLKEEWNFYFDCIGRCFTNKCSNFDALNHLVQHIGYSLIHNANFDVASNILEYLGLRISEGKNMFILLGLLI